MKVENPNNVVGNVEKKSSLFSSLLGFFYNHTKGILKFILFWVCVFSFSFSFVKELSIFEELRFSMNPIEIMFIAVIDALFLMIKIYIPTLILIAFLKFIMIKKRKAKLEFIFNKNFKKQTLIAFLLSLLFSMIFYFDILFLTNTYSKKLVASSIQIFILFFISILMSLSCFYGFIKSVSPILKIKK